MKLLDMNKKRKMKEKNRKKKPDKDPLLTLLYMENMRSILNF